MINREKVIAALEEKRDRFRDFAADHRTQQIWLEQQLAYLQQADSQTIRDRLAQMGVERPGALPTAELDQARGLRLAFSCRWQNHQGARSWALEVLQDRPVLAVDGSQITPTKDFSIPVGAVQVGWFINYHTPGGRYVKDVAFEVLAPQELNEAPTDDDAERGFPDWRVNQLRFVRECEKQCQLLEELASQSPPRLPAAFFDGSLIISFAGQMRPERRRPYVRAVQELLACSQRCAIPVVGFVDSSYSRDLVTLLEVLSGRPDSVAWSDAGLVDALLPGWGDRTPFFLCARDDPLSQHGDADFYSQVAFTYVRLAGERPPARVEVPIWVLETGLAEEVVDLVRAQCVVGTGYPYAIETADALAVISQEDRQRFYALFQQFVLQEGLPFTQARKALSKRLRR